MPTEKHLWVFNKNPKAKLGLDTQQENNMIGEKRDTLRWLAVSNYSLPSNQYCNKDAQTLIDFTQKDMGLLRQIFHLFNDSLPDIFTELIDAIQNEKYSSIPTALITILFNTPLKIFHIAALVPQVFFEVLSKPTRLMNYFFNATKNSENLGAQITFGILTLVSAILTSPFQLCGLVANSIGYVRQIVDSTVTIAILRKSQLGLGLTPL